MTTNTSADFARPDIVSAMDLSTSSAPLKIALLLATGISVHYSLTPPHKAAPKTVVADKTLFERAVQWVTWLSKTMVWMMVLSDILATYLAASHSPTTSPCPHTPPSPLLTPSPTLILGSLASILGNLLRQRCFRELGPMFTFELTIQPDHKLVTSGPYTFVRHPSYTGVYLTLLGPTLVALAPGAWMRESWLAVPANGVGTVLGESSFGCSFPTTSTTTTSTTTSTMARRLGEPLFTTFLTSLTNINIFPSSSSSSSSSFLPTTTTTTTPTQLFLLASFTFWLFKVLFALKSTNRRMEVEDRELRGVFGEVWEEYARRVRWKLVPWVY